VANPADGTGESGSSVPDVSEEFRDAVGEGAGADIDAVGAGVDPAAERPPVDAATDPPAELFTDVEPPFGNPR
jgi:hypothetical protein